MIDERELLERELERFTPDPDMLGRVIRRRERKLRRQRAAAGVLGIAIAAAVTVAAVKALNDQGSDKSHTTPSSTVTPASVTELPEPLVELTPGYRILDVDTGEASPLPSAITSIRGATHFDVSPDGSMILFDTSAGLDMSEPREALPQLFVANIDGSEVRQLTNDSVGGHSGSWSSDGSRIVYIGPLDMCCLHLTNISIVDLDSGAVERVLTTKSSFSDPFFSADGDSVLFTTRGMLGDPGREVLWTISVFGGSRSLILEDRGGEARSSPDGSALTYRWIEKLLDDTGRCASFYGVGWVSHADGSDPRPLAPEATADQRHSTVAVWSPDGTKIAYSSGLLPPVPGGCTWLSDTDGVFVVDVQSGATTLVTYGLAIDWVDDHTLLVRAQRGEQPS
jgi:dipeptidyl aminopeptidase/acylaminoacyl peptidase